MSGRPTPPTPASLFELMLAYKHTAVLSSAVELGIFDSLAAGPTSAAKLAHRLGIAERGARLLLNGLAALGLLDCDGEDGEFRLTAGSAAHLVRGRPGFVGDMTKVMASRWEWEAMGRLTDAVRAGGPVVPEHAETPGYAYWEDFAEFAGAVAKPTADLATDRLEAWAAGRPRLAILDVACGHGLYGFTLAGRHPDATVCSLDWPNVLPVTRRHAERLGLADRMTSIAGDMFEVALGGPYDVVFVTNVLHHFSEERGIALLRRAAEVLEADGRLVLVGFVSGSGPPAQHAAAHLFSLLMLVWTFGGEVHSESTYQRMLHAAGFGPAELHQVPSLPLSVLVAGRLG